MRSRPEEHLTVTLERNIIYYNDANLLGSNWSGGKFALDYNLYWNAGKKGVRFGTPFIGSRAMVGNPVMEEPVIKSSMADITRQPRCVSFRCANNFCCATSTLMSSLENSQVAIM